MPQTTLYIATSVDGYIADANGSVTWLPSGDSNGNDYGYAAFYASVDALLMGRRTYDQVLGFGDWPYPGKPAYVFTRYPTAAAPPGVEFVSADPAGFLSGLAPRHPHSAAALWLVGGANLAEQFRRAGLIDEYRIFVIPIILGQGIPLFGGNAPPTPLCLESAPTHDGGAVELRYRPAPAPNGPPG